MPALIKRPGLIEMLFLNPDGLLVDFDQVLSFEHFKIAFLDLPDRIGNGFDNIFLTCRKAEPALFHLSIGLSEIIQVLGYGKTDLVVIVLTAKVLSGKQVGVPFVQAGITGIGRNLGQIGGCGLRHPGLGCSDFVLREGNSRILA